MKHIIRKITLVIIIISSVILTLPANQAVAKSDEKILVIIEHPYKTYKAYDDIAVVTDDGHIMVKAKPLAKAMGLKYANGNGSKKGCKISSDYVTNAYTRNKTTYTTFKNNHSINNVMVAHATENDSKARLNFEKLVLEKDQRFKLEITGVSGEVKWQTSDKSVATVNNKGTVYARDYGSAIITASIGNATFSCDVTITDTYKTSPDISYNKDGVSYESNLLLVHLNMSNAFDSFKGVGYEVKGIYAAVYSERKIYIEGLNSKGKSIGIHEMLGLSYLEFDNAVSLRIMNPDEINYIIEFIPIKPTVIDKKGYYSNEDFRWYEMKDGNIRAPFILAIINGYFETAHDTVKNGILMDDVFSKGDTKE